MVRYSQTPKLALLSLLFVATAFLAACSPGGSAQPTTAGDDGQPTRVAKPSGNKTSGAKTPAGGKQTSKATPTPVLYDEEGNRIPDAPEIKPLQMNSPEYSVQAFLWYRVEQADRDLTLVQGMGFGWVKQGFAWRDIEGAKKGAFDWGRADKIVIAANARGIDLLARIDNSPDWAAPGCYDPAKATMGPPKNTQDWTDFLTAFVKRYQHRIRAYEIWNEPNLAREWCGKSPDPAAYAKLLKASYQAIKAVDPDAMIISAGLTPTTQNDPQAMQDVSFFNKMYDAMGGKSDGYFDALGVHAAGYKADPEADPAVVAKDPVLTNGDPSPTEAKRIYCFRHVEDVRQIMVKRGDGDKQIVITEFGWTSDPNNKAYSWFRVDENKKADLIVRAYQYAKKNWSPWIGAMSLIYIASPDWTEKDEQYWWAITNPDGTPRPAYTSLKKMAK